MSPEPKASVILPYDDVRLDRRVAWSPVNPLDTAVATMLFVGLNK